jgi:hypothetical protein
MGMKGGAGADSRVRVRIFAYLRANGFSVTDANVIARKLVFAMVGKGPLPDAAATLAGAAVAKSPPGEANAAVLVEPKAEPFEFTGGSQGIEVGMGMSRSVDGGYPKAGGPRHGWVIDGGKNRGKSVDGGNLKAGGPRHGFTVDGGANRGAGGGYKGPVTGAGAQANFAIIEPIMTRREVQARMSTVLARGQVQSLAAEVNRKLPSPR